MRATLVGVVVLTLLVAGCTRPEEDASPAAATSTPSSSPAATAPASPSPSPAPQPSSPSPSPSAPPAANDTPRPYQGFWSHDHNGAPAVQTFDVPAGHAPSDLAVVIFPSQPTMGCDARAATVTVHDPVGRVLRVQGTSDMYCGNGDAAQNLTMRPGRWTIWFNGTAPARSTVGFGDGNTTTSDDREPFRYGAEHDYGNEPEEDTFEVPAGTGPVDVRLAFEPSLAATCVAATPLTLELVPPSGEAYALILGPLGGGATGCGTPFEADGAALAPGTWTVRFDGTGSARGVVSLLET